MIKLFSKRPITRIVSNQCSCNRFSTKNESTSPKDTNTKTAVKPYKSKELKKEDLEWRSRPNVRYYDFLRTFYKEDNNVTTLTWLQQPIDFSPSSIKKWWHRKKEFEDTFLQQYIEERHNILGPELACAHFIVFRGGAVKFHNDNKWIKAVNGEYVLPTKYQKNMYLQAIDCSNMSLRYEGLDNLRDLNNVEWLSFKNCKHIDDFCMDVVSNIFSHSLRYLDLRDCMGVTERGLGAVYKMPELNILYLDDLLKDTRYELTCLLLEELNTKLIIKSDVVEFDIKR
ncbi:unnamed protein product [Ceutorhynchus assimilis]|uniref:Mitochondrial ATP synthase regulatory component factor B n=1 Tax=Ceutorhynchus assimilis TaxID=467358 RepID=A0A9N9QPS4_9CUCU|nr:unnamed protein product [Ceutorhynchus assimilis]